MLRRRPPRLRQKSKRLNKQNNNFVRASRFFFFLISLSSLHINDVTIPIFGSEGRKQETELGYGSQEFKLIRVRLHLTKSASWNIEIEVERTRIYFLSEAFAAVAALEYLINSLLSGCRRRVQATKWDTVERRLLCLSCKMKPSPRPKKNGENT